MGWTADLKTTAGMQAALLEHGPRLATAVLAALLAIQAGVLVTAQNRGAPAAGSGASPMVCKARARVPVTAASA